MDIHNKRTGKITQKMVQNKDCIYTPLVFYLNFSKLMMCTKYTRLMMILKRFEVV